MSEGAGGVDVPKALFYSYSGTLVLAAAGGLLPTAIVVPTATIIGFWLTGLLLWLLAFLSCTVCRLLRTGVVIQIPGLAVLTGRAVIILFWTL